VHAAPARHSLWRRIVACALRWRLDAALAGGADPAADPLLACRAQQLTSSAARRRLAEEVRETVERAAFPRPLGAEVPVAASSVRACSGLLLALARRMGSDFPIAPAGAASVRMLLADGGSPLYDETGSAIALEDAVESALIELASGAR
jgi:hypothetical protein